MMRFTKQHLLRAVSVALVITLILGVVPTAFAFDKVVYANADPTKYRIELDLTNNITSIYEKNSKGKYSNLVKQFICTVGASDTPTPTGTYKLNDSRRRFGYLLNSTAMPSIGQM